VSPEQVDGYRTAGHSLGPIADWFINLIATYGVVPVIAVGLSAIAATCYGLWRLCNLIERRRARQADRRPGRNRADLETCTAIWNTPARSPRKEKP
jgi:hypothetical protein